MLRLRWLQKLLQIAVLNWNSPFLNPLAEYILTMRSNEKTTLTKGILIVFEGIDGTGKSTQLRLLAKSLSANGYEVISTREPTESVYGRRIRELYLNRHETTKEEELELFIMDRKDHFKKLLAPQLAKKRIILCDRYYLSTIAYQGAAGVDTEIIKEKNQFAPEPDIALLLQLPLQLSIERITKNRGDSLNDFEQENSLRKVDEIFRSMNYPYIRRIEVDRPVNTVHLEIYEIVENYLLDFKE